MAGKNGRGGTRKRRALDAPTRRRLPPLLRRAWYTLNQAFRRRIAWSGLTPDQFTILRQLIEGPREGLTQRDLGAQMSSDPNTVASLLGRMQAGGLVERQPHERDRRARRVRILPNGLKLYRRLRQAALELQGQVLDTLPEDRREQFLEDLERVSEACAQAAQAVTKSRIRMSRISKSETIEQDKGA